MHDLGIGKLIAGDAQRDAIHIAVAPVVAGEELKAGYHVGLNEAGEAVGRTTSIGIVDPFIHTHVRKGETFWLFMYPNTITSLRHDWTHPAFKDEPPVVKEHVPPAEAVKEMKKLISDKSGYRGYESIMDDADVWVKAGRATEDSDYDFDLEDSEWDRFWELYEQIRGVRVAEDSKSSFYVCCI
jgi:hypothetical protein